MAVAAALLAVLANSAFGAEHIKFASTRSLSNAPFLIAKAKGYLAAEGLDAEHIIFDAAGPITVAVASGDADLGATGLSGAFFNLAGQGQLRIVAGYVTDAPGFPAIAYVVSNRAWQAGLKSFKDLGGHSVAVTQVGTGLQYSVALLAEKFGIDFQTIRILPMQSYPNELSAATGGNVDVAVVPTNYARPAVESGNVKLLGELGDEVRVQTGTLFVTAKTADERGDMVARFLRAFRHGARDYHDAFVGPDDRPAWGPTAPALAELLAKATQQPLDDIKQNLSYIDADARVKPTDVLRQAAWYKAHGMVKSSIDGTTLIDKRFAILFPEP
jgi:NitT/TauT family transport system substrate-binding protein